MNRDEIITLVLNRCGNRAGQTALVDAAKLELNSIILEEEEMPDLPWFLLTESASATIDAGDLRVALPSDFLLESESSHLFWLKTDGTWKTLYKGVYDELVHKYRSADPGTPAEYAIFGDYYYFYPTPNVGSTVKMHYYGRPTALSDVNLTNEWTESAHDLLIGRLGVVMCGQYIKDTSSDTLQMFAAQAQSARARMDAKEVSRAEANITRRMGGR